MPSKEVLLIFATTALLPFLTSLVLLALIKQKKQKNWPIGIALLAGFLAGFIGLLGLPQLPPILGSHILPYVALLLVLAGLPDSVLKRKVRLLSIAFIALAAAAFMLRSQLPVWGPGTYGLYVLGTAVVCLLFRAAIGRCEAPDQTGPETLLLAIITMSGYSVLNTLDGSAMLGQLAGAAAAAMAAPLMLKFFIRDLRLGLVANSFFCGLFTFFLANTFFFTEVSRVGLLLVGMAPLAGFIGSGRNFQDATPFKRMVLLGALSALCVLAGIAYFHFNAPPEAYDFGY